MDAEQLARRRRPPRAFQFSIGRLLVATTICAVTLAAGLPSAVGTEWWVVLAIIVFVVLFADFNARHVMVGDMAMRAGNYDLAALHYSRAIAGCPEGAEHYYRRGLAHHWQGNLDAASDDYSEAIRLDARDPLPWIGRASVRCQRGAFEQAIDDATVALCLVPGEYTALVVRGPCLYACGRIDEALHDLDEAVRINPDGWGARDARGHVHLVTRDFARALEDFDVAIELNPERGQAQVGRAIALFKLGEHDTALREIADAAAGGPCEAEALCAHAWFLATCPDVRLRDGRRAHELAEAARGLQTAAPWIWQSSLAAALAELGNFAQAAEHAREALDSCPSLRREELTARLAAYEAQKPWRDDGTDPNRPPTCET